MRVSLVLAAIALAAPAVAGATDPLLPAGRWTANMTGNAMTPPMGWNSWNAFATLVDEEKVMGTAQALVDTGLARLGYRYVNIDDGWWLTRRQSDGRLIIRTRIFPSAATGPDTSFRPLTSRLHAMGLKAGIYTDIGRNSCGQSYDIESPNTPEGSVAEREIGLGDHVEKDIRLFFGEWGFDYVKVDACGIDDNSERARATRGGTFAKYPPLIYRDSLNRTNIPEVKARYAAVRDALVRANPDGDFVYSICAWGSANVRAWGKDYGNVIRTSDDIRPTWARMLHVFDSAAQRPLYAQPGSWNDPDMLFVGHGDFDETHLTEAKSHFSLWAIINAPLLIGYDMRKAPKALLDIWGNADLVAANQDRGGHQGVIAYDSEDVQIIVKTLAGSDRKVVALFNRGIAPADVTLMAEHLKFAPDAPVALRDLWSKARLDPFTGKRVFKVAARETLVFEASGRRALADGMYLSEIPGRVNVAHDGVVRPQTDPTVHRMVNPWEGTASAGTRPLYGGWGGAMADQTPYGQTLAVAGTPLATGIGILANSRLEVKNDGEFRRFAAQVGVDDNTPNIAAPVLFEVYGDGRLLARSKPMRFGDPAAALEANVTGIRIVELIVRQANGRDVPASAAWGAARLLK
ncbi:NPCBM/NEW2 domain-containing protein [Sandaracinobacteroides saxicola]|uniref:Alpha-galactosidase n=1 Tax=Sandaracinobacteroides saxicola TaxID=2759707 RepID=A0A7G5IDL7_9SPHN|nr:NPCBM/NEW2 domain-containing protein [Sandaracinobacteroides saxicola]QMW21459.1 NPCBM/NEW2 domain-containing protein [Sandaracinobacteroides saxicola]